MILPTTRDDFALNSAWSEMITTEKKVNAINFREHGVFRPSSAASAKPPDPPGNFKSW